MPKRSPTTHSVSVTTSLHAIRPAWLALHNEPALEPDLPIIDSHHHLWDTGAAPYLVDDLLADLDDGHNVVATVYVQSGTGFRQHGPEALRAAGETEFAASMSGRRRKKSGGWCDVAAGIVGSVDLGRGAGVAALLEASQQAAPARFCGVRALTHWHPDARVHQFANRAGILASPETRAAAAELVRRDLSLDVFCYHTQLDEVVDLARACPDLRLILDHLGTPLGIGADRLRQGEVLRDWRATLKELADEPNVTVKLGGMGMRFFGLDFAASTRPPSSDRLAAAFEPYVSTCLELFGPGRCMFESNFPVDKASYGYRVLWNAFKKLTAEVSAGDRQQLFSGTAARVYRLHTASLPVRGEAPLGD